MHLKNLDWAADDTEYASVIPSNEANFELNLALSSKKKHA